MADLESMTTLVTGATGFVGWHVARLLTRRVNRVRVLVRPQSQLRSIDALNVERAYGDLRDPSSLSRALEGVRQVFHAAADYRLWAKNPNEIYENNVLGTRNLLAASRQAGIERFVYTSSVGTIAVPAGGRLPDEQTQARLDQMIGHYKRSKFMAEAEVMQAAASGFPAVVVNPTTPVGPGDWKPTPTGRIILDFLNGRMPAYVDTGFNVVAVEDVAEGHWLAARHGRIGERYILGERNMTLKEFLDVMAAVTNRPAPGVRLPYAVALFAGYAENLLCSVIGREPRIPLEGVRMAKHKMFVDCSRATYELGFSPSGAEGAIDRAVRWYIDNG
ncbi:MAG TPA: hopanoid-associated sugar epimerase, partial [Terriglobia bacterium]|nr:hopanoid-associated sugar epimerase [Terriglobia bacterium]